MALSNQAASEIYGTTIHSGIGLKLHKSKSTSKIDDIPHETNVTA